MLEATAFHIFPQGATVNATLNRITSNNNSNIGVAMQQNGTTWLAKSVITGNGTGVALLAGTVNSYGDNYIRNNQTPVSGTLTPVTTQ
jgi:hypothetical protein